MQELLMAQREDMVKTSKEEDVLMLSEPPTGKSSIEDIGEGNLLCERRGQLP